MVIPSPVKQPSPVVVVPSPVPSPQITTVKTKKKKMKAVVTYYTTSDESGTEAYAANNVASPA